MPYSNSVGATPNSLTSIAVYLANDGHAHHQDYELTAVQVLGAKSVQDFIDYAKATFQKNSQKKSGPPPKNAANWIIMRTPEGAHLEPQEMTAYEDAARDAAGLGGPIVGILNWHKNKYTGAADMNLLSAAFTASGHLVRDRGSHNVKNLRWRMDQVTDALNVLRKSRGIPPIVTMQEIKKERAQQRDEMDVVEELAKMPKPPTTTADLEPALISLECTISRFNPSRDTISITPKGKKKAKKFRISKLLTDIPEMVVQLRDAKKPTTEITTARKPAAPKVPTKQRKPKEPEISPP